MTRTTDSPALELRGVTKRYGDVTAVDGLDLTLARGRVLALLGPNGAGKTTTIEMCEGFARPDSGTIRVLDQDPVAHQGRLRPRIGVMLQAGGAHGGSRAREALTLVARCARHPHDVDELLGAVGLSAAARTPVRRLSGGQLQRLSLAMALVGRPELLFLDEPTAGMDPQARHLVWDLLRSARAAGVTILLTTHLLDEVELLADDVLIIDHGRRIAQGSPAQLIGSAIRLTFHSAPGLDLDGLRAALPAGATVDEPEPGRYAVTGDVPETAAGTVTTFLLARDAPVHSLRIGRRSLDDVYLELTGRQVRT